MNASWRPTGRDLLLLVALTLMWGVNWPMMKFSLRELSPLWFRAWTMTGGAVLLWLFFRWRGVDLRVPRGRWLAIAGLALPNILGWHGLSIVGLSGLPSGRAAILGFTMPVWTVLVAILLGEQHLSRRVLISVVAATAAVGLLAVHELHALAGQPLAVLWMQGAALSWGLGTVLMRRSQLGMPTESVTVWMMLMGSACFWVIAPLYEPFPAVQSFSTGLWWSLLYGVVLNYGYAQVIWFGMAKRLPPSASAFSIMAVPVVGTLTATVIVGEVPRASDWAAAACVVVAIAAALLPVRAQSQ
ncbi:MAG: DMT family transporter [Betaproteobacteria bacterium]